MSHCHLPPLVRAAIWDLVITDMHNRDTFGHSKYHTRLHAHDGRDPLIDLYQELLDAVVYTRKMIYERDHPQFPKADL